MIKKVIILFFATSCIISAQDNVYKSYGLTKISLGTQIGMYNGVGGNVNVMITNFAENFPLSIKLGMGLSYLDAGDPVAARRIFINNNTNGIPEQSGRTWNLSLDFLYRYSILNLKRNYFYAGPRYVMFTGNFNYIGGNEDFDVTCNQWGIGLGIENYFRIVQSIDLVLNIGYDYYTMSTLYGHDTSYDPSGQDQNPREDYVFEDADKAINQPIHQLKLLIGLSYNIK